MNYQRVDFQRSRLYWNHGSSKSHGAFKVEAVLRVYNKEGQRVEEFTLGTGVLAGNMYVSGRLVKDPSYFFQVAASDKRHVIFRTYTHSNRLGFKKGFRSVDEFDTRNRNDIFESLQYSLVLENAVKLDCSYENIKAHYIKLADFSCKMSFVLSNGYKIEFEYPIKHINISPEQKIFQVETGPILFINPSAALDNKDIKNTGFLEQLVPAFVHFNRFDHADFSIDFPYGVRSTSKRGKFNVEALPCNLQLFVNKEVIN